MISGTKISMIFSYLGQRFLHGDVEVARFLYGNTWREAAPLIRTISELQGCLTSVEIEGSTDNRYNVEFLYYWAMVCIGEQSPLIFKDLGTAETCLNKIKHSVPIANARLAYIDLLRSTSPARAEGNVACLEVLRKWANRHDLFSRIVLAKISFYSFLQEEGQDEPKLPIRVKQLLELPCQQGHPVALRFWNEVCSYLGSPGVMLDTSRINASTLYDFKTSANMQTGL